MHRARDIQGPATSVVGVEAHRLARFGLLDERVHDFPVSQREAAFGFVQRAEDGYSRRM
jgi:hypothetical protein